MKVKFLFLLSFLGVNITYAQHSANLYKMTDTVTKVFYRDYGQDNQAIVEILGKKYPIDGTATLKMDQIESFDVNKEKELVMIGLKPAYKPIFITLTDLKKKYTTVNSNRVIYQIDNKIIQKNPNEISVDESNIMAIIVTPVKLIVDVEELYQITLKTRTENNIKEMNNIYFR